MRKFAKLCLSLLIMLQIIPATSFNINAKDANILDRNVVALSTQFMPEGVIDKNQSTIESNDLTLEVTVLLDKNKVEEKTLVYKQKKNPGELSAKALDGYMLTSMQLDGMNIENNSEIIYEQTTNKSLTINVSTLVELNIHYVDENGTSIKDDVTVEATKGTDYKIETSSITGYDAIATNPTNILLNEITNEVTLQYTTQKSEVIEEKSSVDNNQTSDDKISTDSKGLNEVANEKALQQATIQSPIIEDNTKNLITDNNAIVDSKDVNNFTSENYRANNEITADSEFYTGFYLLIEGRDPAGHATSNFITIDGFKSAETQGEIVKFDGKSYGKFEKDGAYGRVYGNGSNGQILKYTDSTLRNNPKAMGADSGVNIEDYFGVIPSPEAINAAIRANNSDPAKFTVHWYRIVDEVEGFHVDGYLTKKNVANITFMVDGSIKKNIPLEKTDQGKLDINLIPKMEEKKGSTFYGWYEEQDYSGTPLTEEQVASKNFTNEQTFFYGRYIKNEDVKVTFNLKGGNVDGDEKNIAYSISKGLSLNKNQIPRPQKAGYTFTNWVGSDQKEYTNAEISNHIFNESLTFTAQYQKDRTKWTTVTFNAGDNGNLGESKTSFEVLIGETLANSKVIAPTITANKGYKVADPAWDNDYATDKKITEPTTFTAQYVENEAEWTTVTFNQGTNGSLTGTTEFKVLIGETLANSKVIAPTITANKGYKVADPAWDNDYATDKKITEPTTFTAQYVENEAEWTTVTFNQGTNGILSGTTEFKVLIDETLANSKVTEPTITPNTGYLVATPKWTNDYATDKVINEATTFTAQYVENEAEWTTVTFNQGTNGSLTGTTEFKVLIGETLASQGITAPTITANTGYLVATTPWDNDYATDKLVSEGLTFTAQYQVVTTPTEPTVPVNPTPPATTPTDPTIPAPTPGDPTTVAPTPAATPLVTPVVAPTINIDQQTALQQQLETVEDNTTPLAEAPTEPVLENETPLANNVGSSWALLNLVCTILTVLAGVILFFFKRSKEEEDDDEKNMKDDSYKMSDDESKQLQKRSLWVRVVGVVIAIISVAVFFFTENMSNPMVYVDSWTLTMVIIFVAQAITLIIARKWNDTTEEDEETESEAV